jgi:hypothetical protein
MASHTSEEVGSRMEAGPLSSGLDPELELVEGGKVLDA